MHTEPSILLLHDAADTFNSRNSWVFLIDWSRDGTFSKAWGTCTKDVSRDCLLSRGGFWRSRVSSLEPESKRESDIIISFPVETHDVYDLSLNTCKPNSLSSINLHLVMLFYFRTVTPFLPFMLHLYMTCLTKQMIHFDVSFSTAIVRKEG